MVKLRCRCGSVIRQAWVFHTGETLCGWCFFWLAGLWLDKAAQSRGSGLVIVEIKGVL